ncbi:hypothetical protein BT96DRAFT_1005635 [Gymnopus androsaceus JB14]|uniref:Kinesin motor domain-containing protein n=1 Tax=Gymnopus androsaceus JB14 TaxID=1447944 RepID=A0A6A4GNV7_9AGAR|nr:hypothetical protein BT96DRAFT_1005635 [Gymnopus androsaceus JB14]
MHLLDLAGSENNNLTGNNPSRMKESSAIDTSLTALGLVVSTSHDNAKATSKAASKGEDPKLKLIPYCSSSLTRLLLDALGGSSDLVRSVGFASQARRVENKAPTQVKVPTSKTFNFSVPFRSQSSASSSSSLAVNFPSSSTTTDKTLFSSSTSLNKIELELGVKVEPGDSSHSPKRPRHLATTSREVRPRTSPSKWTRTRRASLIPVPAPAANRSGRMSMSMAPEQQQVSLGGAGLGLGVGAGFVMTEEQMQERISKMVQDEVERRLVEIREEEQGRGLERLKRKRSRSRGYRSSRTSGRLNKKPWSRIWMWKAIHCRAGATKKVTKEKVAEVKEEEDVSDLSRASTRVDTLVGGDEQVRDARRDSQDQQEYKKVRVDADDEEIDFLTDPEWEDGNNGEDVVRVSRTHQKPDRVETEVEAPREVEEEEILSKPEQVTDGMDLDMVPEGPSGGWQVPEQEEVDQLIDDGDMDGDMGMFAGIETTTSISASSKHANSQSPAPIAMHSSTSTADGRPAARRSSTSGSTSAAKSILSDALATTSKPKRARNVNAKSQEPATKRQLISSETASTPTRNSSPASAASSSSASADNKQTACAWNELPQALAFYQRAVSFVPALNDQLKDRCILDSSHRRGHDHSLFLCCIPCIFSSNSISISDATATFNSSHSPIPYDYRHRPKPESRHASSVSVPSPLSSLSLSLSSSLPTPSSPSSASLSTGPSSSGTGNSSLTMAFLCGFFRTTPVPKPAQLNVKTDSLPPLLGLPPTPVSPLSFPVTCPIWSQSSSIARSSVRTRTVILNTGTEDALRCEFYLKPEETNLKLFVIDSVWKSAVSGGVLNNARTSAPTFAWTFFTSDTLLLSSHNNNILYYLRRAFRPTLIHPLYIITSIEHAIATNTAIPSSPKCTPETPSGFKVPKLEPEDEGQWEVPASGPSVQIWIKQSPIEASGSGSSSLSSSGVLRSEPFSPLVPAIASPQAIALLAIETPPSPPSITTVSAPAPPVFVEHDTDLDDQMERVSTLAQTLQSVQVAHFCSLLFAFVDVNLPLLFTSVHPTPFLHIRQVSKYCGANYPTDTSDDLDMPYVKPITSNHDLEVAMRNSLERSLIQHHMPPQPFTMPVEFTELRLGSKPANQAETKGYTILEEHMKEFLLEMGVKKENAFTFYQCRSGKGQHSSNNYTHGGAQRLKAASRQHQSSNSHLYHHAGTRRVQRHHPSVAQHIPRRVSPPPTTMDFLPSDNDHLPDSVRRHMEEFRIPAFERKEADTPLRSKFNENTEAESLAEAPMIKMLKAPKPQLKENVNVIGVPFKAMSVKAKRTIRVGGIATFYERQKVKLGVTPLSHLASIDSAGNLGIG